MPDLQVVLVFLDVKPGWHLGIYCLGADSFGAELNLIYEISVLGFMTFGVWFFSLMFYIDYFYLLSLQKSMANANCQDRGIFFLSLSLMIILAT